MRDRLIAEGVDPNALIPAGQEARNTREQTNELVDTCKARGINSVIMASVTYHNARIFSTTVASMTERGYTMEVHCLNAPAVVDENTYEVTASQGKGRRALKEEKAKDRERGIQYLDEGSPVDKDGNETPRWATNPRGYGAPADVINEYLTRRNKGDLKRMESVKVTGD